MKRIVLFLCTGDTCRGPMAAGLAGKLLLDVGAKDIEVKSAGVMTVNGLLPTTETLQMLKSVSVVLQRHRSTPVSVDLLRKCDLVLGMTPLHVQHALRMAPDIKGRVFLLKEFTRSDLKKVQIDDPMGNTLEVYKKVFSEIKGACQKFVKHAFVTGKEDKAAAAKKNARKKPVAKVLVKTAKSHSNGARATKASASKTVAKAKGTNGKTPVAKTKTAAPVARAKAAGKAASAKAITRPATRKSLAR